MRIFYCETAWVILSTGLFLSCAESKEFDPQEFYEISPLHSPHLLGVNENPALQQWDYLNKDNQYWKLIEFQDGTVSIFNRAHQKVIEAPDNAVSASFIYLADIDTGLLSQKWKVKELSDGFIALINQANGMALDVMENTSFNGANILLWPFEGNANQTWKLTNIQGGEIMLSAGHSGRFLSACAVMSQNGANVALWESIGAHFQHWQIINCGNNLYKIKNRATNKVMQASLNLATQSVNVEQWLDNDMPNQKWRILKAQKGYKIENAFSGTSLDVISMGNTNGTNLIHFDYNGGVNQQFEINQTN